MVHALPPFLLRVVSACTIFAACATNQLAWRLVPSVIESPRATVPAVQAPDTMTIGVPDTVTVWTRSGGCTREGHTETTSGDLLVTVKLFDSVLVRAPSNYACTSDLRFGRRAVVIQFSRAGTAMVRVAATDTLELSVVIR